MNRKILALLAFIVAFLALLASAEATEYHLLCLTSGQTVRFSLCNPQIPDRVCTGSCQFCVSVSSSGAYCPASLGTCNNQNLPCTFLSSNSTQNQTNSNPFNISLISPVNGFSTMNSSITFSYNLTNSKNATKCELVLNGNSVMRNTTRINSSTNTMKMNNLSPGFYGWAVKCTDKLNATSTSETRSLTITQNSSLPIAPNVTLLFPENNFSTTSAQISFSYSVSPFESIKSCSLYSNSVLLASNSSAIISGANSIQSALNVGNYTWFVNCTTRENISGISETRKLNILSNQTQNNSSNQTSSAFNVQLLSPQNNYSAYAPANILFAYNYSNITNLRNCSLMLNNLLNSTRFYNTTNVVNSFNLTLDVGTYNWSVICINNLRKVFPSENRTLTIFSVNQQPQQNNTETTPPAAGSTTTPSGGGGGGGGGGGRVSYCATQWSCTSWTSCLDGKQTRTCTYPANLCKPNAAKPQEIQNCTQIKNLSAEKNSQEIDENQNISESRSGLNTITGYSVLLGNQLKNKQILIPLLAVVALLFFLVRLKKSNIKKSRKKEKRKFK